MNMRFSTQAANADVLGDAATTARHRRPDRHRRRRRHAARPKARPQARSQARPAGGRRTKPGKDSDAAGFVKDKDAAKP